MAEIPRLRMSLSQPGVAVDNQVWPPTAHAAVTSLDLQAGEDGVTTAQYSVLGDARSGGGGPRTLTLELLRERAGSVLRSHTVPGLIDRGGAVYERPQAGRGVTRLSASTRPAEETRLPDVTPWRTVRQISRRSSQGRVRTYEVRHAGVNAIVRAAVAAAGGTVHAEAPWREDLALAWVLETTPTQVPAEPPAAPYSTLGKTLSAVLGEFWSRELGYWILWEGGVPSVHRRVLGDTRYTAPVLAESTEEIDYDSPSAVIVRGSEVQRDPLTGLYIITPEMSGDPGVGSINVGGPGPASVTEVSTTTTTMAVRWDPAPGAASHEVLVTGGPEELRWVVGGDALTITGLTPGTAYTVAVRGVIVGGNLTGRTQWGPELSVELPASGAWAEGTEVIASLTGRESESGEVELSWATVSEWAPEGGYTLTREPALPQGAITLGPAETSWVDPQAGQGVRRYALVAHSSPLPPDSSGPGATERRNTSAPAILAVDSSVGRPPQVRRLTLTTVGTTLGVTLAPAPRASRYRFVVRRGEATLIDTTLPDPTTGPGDRTFTLGAAALDRATAYTLWVYPVNNDGTGPGTEEEFVTPSAAGTPSTAVPRDGSVQFSLPATFADGSTMTERHTITSEAGRVIRHEVVATVTGQRRAGGTLDGPATQVLYSGRVSVRTTTYAYGLTRAPESRLPAEVESIATRIRTVEQRYGPNLAADPPSNAETLLSTEETLEALTYSTGTGYLQSKVTTTSVTSSLSTMLSGATSITETHVPLDAGRWLHTTAQQVSRLVNVFGADGTPSGYTTDLHTTPRSETNTTPPDRLPWTGDTDPGLIVAEAPEFRWELRGEQAYAEPDIPGVPARFEGRVELPGRGPALEINLPFLYAQISMQALADIVAARYGTRRRITRTYLAPVPVSLTDPGVLRYSMQIGDRGGAPRVQVTTEMAARP